MGDWSQTLRNAKTKPRGRSGGQSLRPIRPIGKGQQINQSQKGQALQIAKITDGRFTLDKNALSGILLKDIIRNRPVVVVSIAGDMRKGMVCLNKIFN